MTEYLLRDADNNNLQLNSAVISEPTKSSLTLGRDRFSFENEIIENSSLPGSVKLGKTRIRSREMIVRFNRAVGENPDTLRESENDLLEFLNKVVYLVDNTRNLIVPIAIKDYSIEYDVGGHQLSSDNEILLELLDPFWKAETPDNINQAIAIGTNDIIITNSGFLATPPIITFTASAAVTQLKVYVNETKEGIQIDDSLFGTGGYDELIINCELGTLELEGFDRTESILPGTGYFTLPVGTNVLKIVSTEVCNIDIDFYKRYFI